LSATRIQGDSVTANGASKVKTLKIAQSNERIAVVTRAFDFGLHVTWIILSCRSGDFLLAMRVWSHDILALYRKGTSLLSSANQRTQKTTRQRTKHDNDNPTSLLHSIFQNHLDNIPSAFSPIMRPYFSAAARSSAEMSL